MKHGYIGARLRAARTSKKVSVQQLAGKMGIAIETILDIEAGATLGHSSTIIEMGKVLGLSLTDLFGPTEDSNIIPFPKIERDK
ncbi:helix-turn-helix domain-containing protein [Anderseniella sp. Alg231-50]|uniref:helix-turn-helix domain-containing protein n=1 Tax=Anderseniella sp. Alg231-50 TaxID=1922226 RepID=UPI00307C97F8